MLKYSSLLALVSADLGDLINGPANFPQIIADGTVYTDETFKEDDLMNGEFLSFNAEEITHYKRISVTHDLSPLFGATSTNWFNDIKMHTSDRGVQPSLAAIGAIGKSQDMVKDKFVTQTREKTSGIYAIRIYLKGKPWVLTIDNYLLDDRGTLKFTELPSTNGPIWAPLLLKAWAKTLGSYYYVENKGTQVSALKAFTGCPTFTLKPSDFESDAALFDKLKEADTAGYFMGVKSKGGTVLDVTDDPTDYSLISVMTLTNAQGHEHKLYLLRDPSGLSFDDTPDPWKPNSAWWTTHMKNQLPYGLSPDDFEQNGLIVLESNAFYNAIDETYVAHCKDGYSPNWFDVDVNLGTPNFFSAEIPAKDGDIYVSIDPFAKDFMSWAHPSSFLSVNFKTSWEGYPIVKIPESDYEAGHKLDIMAWVTWWGLYSDASYTVTVYSKQDIKVVDLFGTQKEIHMDGKSPSGFKDSTYSTSS